MNAFKTTLACLAMCVTASPAIHAATSYSEAVSGDLSTDPATPTALAFSAGSNLVSGSMFTSFTVGVPGDTRDYLTFTLGANQQLDAIIINRYDDLDTSPANDGNRGFAALFAGPVGTLPANGNNLGGNHVDPNIGFDLLASFATGGISGGTGFPLPLGAGSYTFLIQQTGPQLTGYELDFKVSAVPVPAAVWLFAPAVLAFAGARRRLTQD